MDKSREGEDAVFARLTRSRIPVGGLPIRDGEAAAQRSGVEQRSAYRHPNKVPASSVGSEVASVSVIAGRLGSVWHRWSIQRTPQDTRGRVAYAQWQAKREFGLGAE